MFSGCSSVTKLNLSSFNTKNVTDMTFMFGDYYGSGGCSSLTTLDLSSFNASKADTSDMFEGCKNLTNCNCSDVNIKKRFNKK